MEQQDKTKFIFDIETTGLNPTESRIICISVKNLETNNLLTFIDINEANILSNFWKFIRDKNALLVGYNSDSFDIPFLIHRSLVNRVEVSKFESLDLRKQVNAFFYSYDKYAKGTLEYWGKIMGYENKIENGEMMGVYFINLEYNKIQAHCEYDIFLCEKLYWLLKDCKVIE